MRQGEDLSLLLNKHPERINTYLPMITTLARMSCVKALSPKDGFPAKVKALCPELRSYQIETPEGITYRRTQNHLKPFQLCQKVQIKEQHEEQYQKRTPNQLDFTQIPPHPKRQIKVPTKLNL